MLGIFPAPPIQQIPAWQLGLAAALAVTVGVACLLWGRILHRALLMLAGAGAAYWLSVPLAGHSGLSLPVVRICAVLLLTAMGLILARIAWGLLGAGILAGLACLAVLPWCLHYAHPPPWSAFGPTESLQQWLAEAGSCLWAMLQLQWQHQRIALIAAAGAAAGLPLILFLLRPRLAAIFMSALLGALLAVGGPAAAIGRASASLWAGAWKNWYVPAGLMAMLFVAGMIFQYRGAIAADRSARADEEELADKDKTKTSDNADKD